jgi:hypothetical protein
MTSWFCKNSRCCALCGPRLEWAVVGWVSPSGRNPTNGDAIHQDVGLRDETANPTYKITKNNALRANRDGLRRAGAL